MSDLEKQLEALRQEYADFAYVVSHDLKEPVRGMKTFAQFTLEDYEKDLAPDAVQNLKRIMAAADRFNLMMEGLLEISRLRDRVRDIDNFPVDSIIHASILEFDEDVQAGNTEITYNDTGLNVSVDQVELKRILKEIISNAIVYNESEKKEINISCADINGTLTISVKDNGVGLEEKYHKKLWQIFYRLNGKDKFGSRSGCGLCIVDKLIKANSGEIKIVPLDIGTEFQIILPLEKPTN